MSVPLRNLDLGGLVVKGPFYTDAVDAKPPIFSAWRLIGASDKQLAALIGRSPVTVNHWTSGRKRCPPHVIIFLTNKLALELDALEQLANCEPNASEILRTALVCSHAFLRLSQARCAMFPTEAHQRAKAVKDRLDRQT